MEKRRLGRTEHMSSMVIFGGAALGNSVQEEAYEALELCLEAGINHIDIAPSYGHAEALVGPWLQGHRDKFFLACKTGERTYDGAWRELEQSLKNLKTDKLDLHQFHAVKTFEELDAAFADEGAVKAMIHAKEQGLTKFLGITGHGKDAPAIQLAALERFDLDTVMFPLNPVLYGIPEYRENAEKLLKLCEERDLGAMIIKSIAKQPWGNRERTYNTWYEPYDMQDKIDLGVRFALSQSEVTGIPAAGDTELLPMVIKAAENYTPMSEEDQTYLISQSKELESLFV